ncbi:MAG: hypothetical protein HWD83_05500 [Gammaproteobacteria bacterium]|nr:hypothetical protein [Gammaproteobacteria bacterium]
MNRIVMCLMVPLLIGLSMQEVYADRLPPGLEKKKERGKALPPGWANRVEVGQRLEDDIYIHGEIVVPVGANGEITIEVGGHLIRLLERTREVLEMRSIE